MTLYPLLLEPIYKEKVWGGRRLERLGRSLPGGADTLVGESWEVADLAATAVSGGGGGAARSVVANGPLRGRTLGALLADDAGAVLGRARPAVGGGFPLLVKYLDARESLSVQVHPSAEYAARHPDAHLKSEAWYVVAAEPGAVIYKGVVAGKGRADFEAAIGAGTVSALLGRVPAVAGDCHYLPSGTCHALGAGVLVAEVQTPSDTTFRVFDWDRRDRELHIAAALECIDFGPASGGAHEPRTRTSEGGTGTRALVRCEHFHMDEWTDARGALRVLDLDGPEVWMVVEGEVEARSSPAVHEPVRIPAGRTALLPAALGRVEATSVVRSVVLRVRIPLPAGDR